MGDTSAAQTPLLAKSLDSAPQSEKEGDKHKVKPEKTALTFKDIGVWTVMRQAKSSWTAKVPGLESWTHVKDILGMLPLVYHFMQECFSVGPWLVATYCLATLWTGTHSAVSLYFSSRLLDIIQDTIVNREVHTQSLVIAVASRIAFTLTDCVMDRFRDQAKAVAANRIRYLFDERLIQSNLRLDLPTFEEPETAKKINRLLGRGNHGGAWEAFEDLLKRAEGVASVLSQLSFLFGLLRSHPGAVWFAVLCIAKTILEQFTYDSLWSEASFIWASNTHYGRMGALVSMVRHTEHRIEVVSDVLMDWICREWTKARRLLGDLSDDYPDRLFELSKPVMVAFVNAVSDDLPMIFYAYQVLRSPASFSLTSVALMQQTSATLGYTISRILNSQRSIQQRFSEIRSLYETDQIPIKVQDGELEYPPCEAKPSLGMEITFQNVSFAYPGADRVVKDVSFTIRRGQTIVIVGVNGSGKSTLLKLFNRLYDPTEGMILVDGIPMRSFNASDLRRSSAMLFQKYSHYPLPIWENISLGLPDEDLISSAENEERGKAIRDELVEDAARLGGSSEFIKEQPKGFNTVLQPHYYSWATSTRDASEEFRSKMKEINKQVDVSAGQWQRLALSRLFYRAKGKGIKMVAVDEPSASLDPKMEYDLFESLRELSTAKGKTMVFVTHRFGYLTKRADLILVMQNGCLVEQGKHHELVQMGGEYAKLYNLQAEAFLPDDITPPVII